MDDLKPQKKNRFEKGSEAAKEFMATLRAKKGKKSWSRNIDVSTLV